MPGSVGPAGIERSTRLVLLAVLVLTVWLGWSSSRADAAPGDLMPVSCIDDAFRGECEWQASGLRVDALAGSPDGQWIYSAGLDRIVEYRRNSSNGTLVVTGCLHDDDYNSSDWCRETVPGLSGVRGVAMSADGRDVYAAARGDGAITHLRSDPVTGRLEFQGCIADRQGDWTSEECEAATPGLFWVVSVHVSSDGESVYAVSEGDDAIVHFARDQETGALTPEGCIADRNRVSSPDGCAEDASGLDEPADVAASPDGTSVYVVSRWGYVVEFDRDPSTREVAFRRCLKGAFQGGDGQCPGTPGFGPLLHAGAVVVHPDGRSVYVGGDARLLHLYRDPQSGALSPRQCIVEPGSGGCDVETLRARALRGGHALAISPESDSLYLGASASVSSAPPAVFHAGIDAETGDLVPHGCIDRQQIDPANDRCAQHYGALRRVSDLAASADGKSLYVGGLSRIMILGRGEVPPDTGVAAGPDDPTNDTTPTFELIASEAGSTFECSLDAVGFSPCPSFYTTPPLRDGFHIFEARATDPGGETDPSPRRVLFRVDTEPPETTITGAPPELTNAMPNFTYQSSKDSSRFSCRLVPEHDFVSCPSYGQEYRYLDDGEYTFEVYAIDQVGNADPTPAEHSFRLDATAPETTITAAPNRKIRRRSARFEFESSESGSRFRCKLSRRPWSNCSSPQRYRKLRVGRHRFQVRAIDVAENADPGPATYRFWRVRR